MARDERKGDRHAKKGRLIRVDDDLWAKAQEKVHTDPEIANMTDLIGTFLRRYVADYGSAGDSS